ncbi:MAG: hypothetical protein U5M23_15250 [Marinagarivorans sp.]|nr:hypothetical protein [Marinagarivorans sp.]
MSLRLVPVLPVIHELPALTIIFHFKASTGYRKPRSGRLRSWSSRQYGIKTEAIKGGVTPEGRRYLHRRLPDGAGLTTALGAIGLDSLAPIKTHVRVVPRLC